MCISSNLVELDVWWVIWWVVSNQVPATHKQLSDLITKHQCVWTLRYSMPVATFECPDLSWYIVIKSGSSISFNLLRKKLKIPEKKIYNQLVETAENCMWLRLKIWNIFLLLTNFPIFRVDVFEFLWLLFKFNFIFDRTLPHVCYK